MEEAEDWDQVARARIVAVVRGHPAIALDVRLGIAVGEPGWWPTDVHAQAITLADAALYRAIRFDTRGGAVVQMMPPSEKSAEGGAGCEGVIVRRSTSPAHAKWHMVFAVSGASPRCDSAQRRRLRGE